MKHNLLGRRFNRWLVLAQAPSRKSDVYWFCRCDCGTEKIVLGANLRNGKSISCGCYRFEWSSTHNRTHGLTKTRAYGAWSNMRRRCTDPKNSMYVHYGGRGITVCPQWLNSVEQFFADMGECSKGYSLERIDNNKGYSPENCEWIPFARQAVNTRKAIRVEYQGKEVALKDLARHFGISHERLRWAYKKLGLSVEDAIACVQQTRKSSKTFRKA